MTRVTQFTNRKFLLDFAERLREEWKEGHGHNYTPKLTAQITLLEEMSVYNNCVYSLFDFEEGAYLFYTRNLFDMIGLDPQAKKEAKWNHAYTAMAKDHKPVENFLSQRAKVLSACPNAESENFQSAIGGCNVTNLAGKEIRILYRSRPLSFNASGNVKVSFDCASNIIHLMTPETGYWMRFAFDNKFFCWHSNSKKLTAKNILSPREIELIAMWNSGLSISAIAQKINVSTYTVKNQLANARKRLFARDNTSLARLCSLIGVLEPYF